MPTATLVRMAQQIARNNSALTARRAADRIAAHLKAYWTPEMIADLEVLASTESGLLDPNLVAALGQLAARP